MTVRFGRLEALLGAPLDALNEAALNRLVAGQVREDTDLDFKSELYGNGDSARRDLAGDVAAMANTVGGAIVLGVDEVDAVAVGLSPVALSDGEELRMRQIVAANVAPQPQYRLHRVPSAASSSAGWYVLEVPRSLDSPHAVRVGDALRFPRRDGARIRYLSESEVADAYRSRFTAASAQLDRVARVRLDGASRLGRNRGDVWLHVATVPDIAGELTLTRPMVREARNFLRSVRVPLIRDSALRYYDAEATTGHRSIVLKLSRNQAGLSEAAEVHLHADGASSVNVNVTAHQRPRLWDIADDVSLVEDEQLIQELIYALGVSAAHAQRCHAGGVAAVEATLSCPRMMQLSHGRGQLGLGGTWAQHAVPDAPISQHTVALDDIASDPRALLIGARMVVTDLFQGFGLAECPQVSDDGALRKPYWACPPDRLASLSSGFGIEVRDEKID